MPVKVFRPLTPSTRYVTIADYSDITKSRPEKSLVFTRKKTGGRNCYGRITSRGIGQGHKQKNRTVDFKRHKHGIEAAVTAIVKAAKTGKIGDGKIFVTPIEEAIRIRTEEKGEAAV